MVNLDTFEKPDRFDANSFLIERYKYILEQKREANQVTFKVAAIYQAIFVPVVGCQLYIIKEFSAKSISSAVAKKGSAMLVILTLFVCIICCMLIVGGILSWLKYRRDECEIEKEVYGVGRPTPKFKDILRWYETYLLASMIGMAGLYLVCLPNLIVPMLNRN